MYPNPQQALPLPTRPNVEQYKTLAKDLVKACKSGEPAAVREWAVRWIEKLAALQHAPDRCCETRPRSAHTSTPSSSSRGRHSHAVTPRGAR